jgi:hypothetical protein
MRLATANDSSRELFLQPTSVRRTGAPAISIRSFGSIFSSICLTHSKESFMSNAEMMSVNTGNLKNVKTVEVGPSVLRGLMRMGSAMLLVVLTVFFVGLAGCGSGGYAGGGVVSLSASSVTLDAGQSFMVSSKLEGSPVVTWALSSAACSGSQCGSLSSTTGTSVTYTAPAGITSQLKLTLMAGVTGTQNSSTVSITVNPDPTISGTPPVGTVGTSYTTTLTAAGGTAPLKLSVLSGALPDGLSFNAATGVISGTPTTVENSSFTVQVIDSSDIPDAVTAPETIVISTGSGSGQSGPLTVIGGNPPAGTVGVAYTTSLSATGGTVPYTWSVLSGALPAGLTLGATSGVIAGTPTTQGVANFTAQVKDATGTTASAAFSITINAASGPGGTLTLTSPVGATVGVPYSGTIGVSGGTGPYTCVVSGTLPAGLSANGCVISGTPTAPGTSTITVTATDSGNPPLTTTGPVTLTVAPAAITLTLSSPPNATVGTPYTGSVGVAGGTAPYACVITGTLPAGLTATSCAISGTPTVAGTANLNVTATDSSNPAATTTGAVTLIVSPAPVVLTLSSPPNATVGTPYTGTVGVAGGASPYACVITGTLPAGLTANSCVISGTPTVAGMANLNVKATDSSSPTATTTGMVTLTVLPAGVVLTISSPPNATVGTPYTGSVGVGGGSAPYSCVITGTLPAGLTANNCAISGTPTVAGTANLTVKATDSNNPAATTTGPATLVVSPAAAALTLSSPPNGMVGTLYNGSVGVGGGTGPYNCVITGALPAGLTANSCAISGTPTAAGMANLSVKATDSSSPAVTTTGPVTLTITPASATLTLSSPPNATVGTLYNGSVGVAGGTGPYSCVITGTLPAGLTANSCAITGTPTTAGTANLTVKATDSGSPAATTTGPVTLTVLPIPALSLTGSLPNATVNVAYSQTLAATGGVGPYTYTKTAGTLPPGITLSSNGVISGTPTAVGASSFTVTATDSEGTPQTASLPLILLVVYATTTTDSELTGPYAFLFQGYDDVVAGVLAYQTGTAGSFTADGTGVVSGGELDSNHQSSTATGATVSSNAFLGSYQLNSDNRGLLAITTLHADGTTGGTAIYSIAVKAPVSPSTISTEGNLIEFDDNNLVGTRGSGMLLAQQSSAFAAGLNGSYVFGMQGDTPCLPTCTLGIIAGPAAAVGQFTASGSGVIATGTSDANIASDNIPSAELSGSYGAADGNGRLQLTMNTADTPTGVYPSDYAMYMVNANQAFVVSTDKHSDYILLSGSTQLQTQSSFSDASMTGAFVGYENSPTNPGLVAGLVLENTLNLSTATIFRGTATSNGKCDITNVDTGGTASLVSGLTGILGSLTGLTDLLGSYTVTGPTTCDVSTIGRGTLQYPLKTLLGLPIGTAPAPRVFYLSSPDKGYFLETGYAGLGNLEEQTGGPFAVSTFDGTYVYGSTPAGSLASINSSGVITADGAGHATSTLDENVGVGTLNVLDIDVTNNSSYALTDATAGRYTLGGSTVIYAINPNRYVLLDTSLIATSPTVTLLY